MSKYSFFKVECFTLKERKKPVYIFERLVYFDNVPMHIKNSYNTHAHFYCFSKFFFGEPIKNSW